MHLGGTVRLNKIGVAVVCGIIIVMILYMSPRSSSPFDSASTKVNLRRLLLVSIEAAEKGGWEVIKVINQANLKEESKGETKEGVKVPVTNADYKSHCVMYYGIKNTFPSVKVISEEKKGENECQHLPPMEIEQLEKTTGIENLADFEANSEHVTVWIDPLDATKEYTEGLYQYVTTMVCVAYQGRPIIGVIHKPFGPEPKTTWAWIHFGMSKHLNHNKPKSDKKVVMISKSHPGKVKALVQDVFGEDTGIIPAGGAGYKALEVATGNATAYLHNTEISKWDVCAGDVIISSLEGSFLTLDGNNLDYSASSDPVNKDGILATLDKPEQYIQKLKEIRKTY